MHISFHLKRKHWLWIAFLLLVITIKWWSKDQYWVESYYTGGFYAFMGRGLRAAFGRIPFSLGDILYFAAGGWVLWKLIVNTKLVFQKKITAESGLKKVGKLLLLAGFVYIIFNIFWGLNYNRKGIAWQLHLPKMPYDTASLNIMQHLLLQKVNETKMVLVKNKVTYPGNRELFQRAAKCYGEVSTVFPFMKYQDISVKSSFYGWLGDYLGFTGYYNPFTGEAQVNTTVPRFLLPYITLHEIGHQIGYAKEDEANFSGYLAAAYSSDTLFQYSMYLDLFVYANREMFYVDSAAAKCAALQLIPEVRADLQEWKRFNRKYRSVFEPAISWMYDKYLLVNEQPQGLRSYNQVIATLMAYYRKFGKI